MTATTPIPTSTESPLMDQTTEADPADPRPDSPSGALSSGHASSPVASVRPTLRVQVAENPLASFFGAVIVALLVSMLATSNVRINRLEDQVEAGFAAQDAKIDKLEAKLDAKIDGLDAKLDAKFGELDEKFDEMNLKLTALIAKLNATDDVDAAVEGRLTDRDGDSVPDPAGSGVG